MPTNQEKFDALHWNLIGEGRKAYEQSIANKAGDAAARAVWAAPLPDPNAPGKMIEAKYFLTYANDKAGRALAATENIGKLDAGEIAAAIPVGIAQSVVDLLAEKLGGSK